MSDDDDNDDDLVDVEKTDILSSEETDPHYQGHVFSCMKKHT